MSKKDEVKEPEPIPEPDPAVDNQVQDVNSAAERLEQANEKMAELLARQEELQMEKTLGGQTEAGAEQVTEMSDKEYTERVMNGEVPKIPGKE